MRAPSRRQSTQDSRTPRPATAAEFSPSNLNRARERPNLSPHDTSGRGPISFIGVNKIDRVTSHRNRIRRSHDHRTPHALPERTISVAYVLPCDQGTRSPCPGRPRPPTTGGATLAGGPPQARGAPQLLGPHPRLARVEAVPARLAAAGLDVVEVVTVTSDRRHRARRPGPSVGS